MSLEKFSGETAAERRRFPRVPLKLKLYYQCLEKDSVSPPESNLAKDLAAGGLAMYSERVLRQNQLIMLTLYLPLPEKRRTPEGGEAGFAEDECQAVNILARVAWCAPAHKVGFQLGMQFLDMDRDDRKTLKEFLIDYRLYQPDSPLLF